MNDSGKSCLMIAAIMFATMAWIFAVLHDGGAGVTWDEPWYVNAGALYTGLIDAEKAGLPDAWAYNHEHPPLAKMLMGVGEYATAIILPHRQDALLLGARATVMLLFGAMLIGVYLLAMPLGTGTAVTAVLLCAACPRLTGHAQLATLDLPLVCFMIWTMVGFERATLRREPEKRSRCRAWPIAACIMCGFAQMTKFSGVIIFAILGAWILLWTILEFTPGAGNSRVREERKHAIGIGGKSLLLFAMFAVAWVMLIAGWPWLWQDPGERIYGYLLFSTRHNMTPVMYLGKVYGANWGNDAPPWHYGPVMLLATTPVLVIIGALPGTAGMLRARQSWREKRILSLITLGALALPCASMLPGAVCYDGVRLLLFSLPLGCVLAAYGLSMGAKWIAEHLCTAPRPRAAVWGLPSLLAAIMLATNSVSVEDDLAYYNLPAGGRAAPRQLGMDTSYWASAFRPALLKRVFAPFAAKPEIRVRLEGFGSVAPDFMRICGIIPRNARLVTDDSWDILLVVPRQSYAPARKLLARFRDDQRLAPVFVKNP